MARSMIRCAPGALKSRSLYHHLHGQTARRGRQRRQREHRDLEALDLAHGLVHRLVQLLCRALAVGPGLQDRAGEALIDGGNAGQHERRVCFGKGPERLVELVAETVHVVDVGVLRRLGLREQHALVLLWGELRETMHIEIEHAREDAGGEDQRHQPVIERGVEPPAVGRRHPGENAVDQLGKAPLVHRARQQHRAHHRRERERDHAGDDHRAREGEGELAEEHARKPGLEPDRRIDGGQRDGHGDDRPHDLARADQRRLHRRLAALDVAINVLHHHDGVVDHEPDRQHEGEQRQQVQAEAHGQHEHGDADQRQRDGDHRDHHRAEAAEEKEDHHNDDRPRLTQGPVDLVDRGRDEFGAVIGDRHLDRGWQFALDRGQEPAHARNDVQGISERGRVDADEDRVLAAHGHARVRVLRAEVENGDILQAHQRAVLRLHHHVAELVEVRKAGLGGDVDQIEIALGLPGRRLEVVDPDRGGHIVGGDAARGHARGIEPDPHGERLPTENVR